MRLQHFDEMYTGPETLRPHYKAYAAWLADQPPEVMAARREEAEMIFRRVGITFAVYGAKDEDGAGTERLIPFDLIPRIIPAHEWAAMEKGLVQRVTALNAFIHDVYHGQEIIKAGRIPRQLIEKNDAFLPEMIGFRPPGGVYTHIVGTDIVRTGEDQFYVLEDNARTPSGVSYMLENRETMMQMFPELFQENKVQRVEDYPYLLRQSLASLAPPGCKGKPRVAVLTPGIYNSAYYEHSFLADMMGVELVEGSDLRVIDGKVKMRTTRGYEAIDVLYRRVDDDFLDPLTFRPDSCLGVPGIMASVSASPPPLSPNARSRTAMSTFLPTASPSPTRRAPASPTTRRSIPTCRRSSSSTPAARRFWKTYRPGAARKPTA